MPGEFERVFERLTAMLRERGGNLTIKDESPKRFSLIGGVHPTHRTPMPIAWVEVGKAYVSYHLMPVYGHPKLLEGYSAKLKARMQGKSCFNFKVCDEALFEELDRLTVEGFGAFRKAGFMPA
jgi:hypothetical protein